VEEADYNLISSSNVVHLAFKSQTSRLLTPHWYQYTRNRVVMWQLLYQYRNLNGMVTLAVADSLSTCECMRERSSIADILSRRLLNLYREIGPDIPLCL
jgi:hypothetical protein